MDVSIPCICPPKGDEPRHEADRISLRDTLDFRTAISLRNSVAILYAEEPDADLGDVMAVLTDGYLTRGIESWTLVDEKGKPVPVSRAAIRDRLLSNLEVAETVGDVADELYSPVVMLPLLRRASKSLPATPTEGSTSPTTPSSTARPRRSKRSSTSTSLTVVTEATSSSLVGDSSLSPSSVSAA